MSKTDDTEYLSDFSRFQVLLLLFEEPRHGYNILSEFRKRVGKDVSPSLVYPFLQNLEEKALVTSSVAKIGKKEKKVYELTHDGRVMCDNLFKRFASLVSAAIEPSLDVCVSCGAKIFEGGFSDIIDNQKTMFCCEHCARAYMIDRGILAK